MAVKNVSIDSVGSIIWWTVSGDHEKKVIDPLALKHGVKVIEKSVRSAYTSALAELNKNANMVTKKVQDDFMKVVHVIAETKRDPAKRQLAWGDQSWVVFDKVTEDVTWKEKDPRTEEFKKKFLYYQEHYKASDMRGMIENEVQGKAISLRSSGGIYFLPEAEKPRIMELSNFLDAVSPRAYISIVAILKDDTVGIKSVQKEFEENSKMTLDRMLQSVDEAIASSKSLDPTHRNGMLKQLIVLDKNATAMEALLAFKATKLTKKIGEVRKILQATALAED